MLRDRRLRLLLVLLVCAGVTGGLVAFFQPAAATRETPRRAIGRLPRRTGHPGAAAQRSRRPNVVFVLTDDVSMHLLRFMPHVQAMARRGLTFNDYFVSHSLCCPSR